MNKMMKGRGMIGKRMWVLILVGLCNISPLLIFDAYAQSGSIEHEEAFWLWQFMGRLHPLAVHFPVGLLLFAAVLELFTVRDFNSKFRPGINLLVYVGAFGAIIAALLGLILANAEDYGGDTLAVHQWTGIATAVFGTITFFLLFRTGEKNKPKQVKWYRGML